jgi:hypothetical protein
MLDKLLPGSLDNGYKGYRTALWIFGLVIAVRAVQSIAIIFNGHDTAVTADGIPLDAYVPDAAQTILALFAIVSLWRLLFSILGAIVLLKYRSGVPLMFALLLLHFLAAQLLSQFVPMVRVGKPPATYVNLVQLGLIVIGLVLSLLPGRPARMLPLQ